MFNKLSRKEQALALLTEAGDEGMTVIDCVAQRGGTEFRKSVSTLKKDGYDIVSTYETNALKSMSWKRYWLGEEVPESYFNKGEETQEANDAIWRERFKNINGQILKTKAQLKEVKEQLNKAQTLADVKRLWNSL